VNVHTRPHTELGSIPLGCYHVPIQTIPYFSLFSGIGGFELGIERSFCDCPSRQATEGEDLQEETYPYPHYCSRRSRSADNCSEPSTRDSDATVYWRTAGKPISDAVPVRCVGFSEIDKYATQIYLKHFPSHQPYGDISKIDAQALPDFDLLCGGFPCQAFSIAGKRRGFEDTRGTLFFEIARLAAAKRPRLLFLENVKGLLSHDEGRTFYTIIETLDELGYDLQWQVLNSKDFGVPQNRERVFIVGHLRGTPRPEVFPFTDHHLIPFVTTTLRAHQGGPNANDTYVQRGASIRRLTPIECERLQGFPDGWTEGISDTQRYKCLGNAVTVNVIEAIATKLLS
jgi:DNA (cytosine-5)-methyltransferase 1